MTNNDNHWDVFSIVDNKFKFKHTCTFATDGPMEGRGADDILELVFRERPDLRGAPVCVDDGHEERMFVMWNADGIYDEYTNTGWTRVQMKQKE